MVDAKITSTNGKNKVIDFRDCLRAVDVDDYAKMHNGGGKGQSKSSIRVTICDYSKGKGENSVTVSASIEPEIIYQLYEVVKNRISNNNSVSQSINLTNYDAVINDLRNLYQSAKAVQNTVKQIGDKVKQLKQDAASVSGKPGESDFAYSQDRVHVHQKKGDGTAPINKLIINRSGIRSNGQKSNYPWYIKITNGIAPVIEKEGGSINYEASKMKVEKEAYINVSDSDMFRMMLRIKRYIETWENAQCISVVREGLKKRQQEYINAANNRS